MNANELRVGNYVNSDESGLTEVNGHLIAFLETPKSIITGFVEPIPLTEEWLAKLGVTHKYENEYYLAGGHWEFTEDGFIPMPWYTNEGFPTGFKIKHVHQLQNLYFALTGEELTQKT
jgi:hypothetical protein